MRIATLLLFLLLAGSVRIFAQSASPSAGCAPLDVQFTGTGSGPFFWDFGDGATSNLLNPNHVYTSAGTYTVELRQGSGGALIGTVQVNVFPTPELQLNLDTNRGCRPLTVQADITNNLGAGVVVQGYTWAFGNGNTGTGTSNTINYLNAGVYDISVRIETNISTCNRTQIFQQAVTVHELPVAAFSTNPSPPAACDPPLTVSLSNFSSGAEPLAYAWNFGNGNTSTERSPSPQLYSEPGNFNISLQVTDANGCSSTVNTPVSAGGLTADFELPDTVCFGAIYTISAAASADVYNWSFGPGINVIEPGNRQQEIQFTREGPTTISLNIQNTRDGCTADTVRTIFVERPRMTLSSEPSYSCQDSLQVNYQITPEGTVLFRNNLGFPFDIAPPGPTITYQHNDGGEYGYNNFRPILFQAFVVNERGCSSDTLLVIDTLDVPNALFFPDFHYGCAPFEVTFSDSSRSRSPIVEYTINWGDGQVETFTTNGPWTHTYLNPGSYEPFISVVTSRGCVDTSYTFLIEVGEPVGDLSFDAIFAGLCPGDTIRLNNTSTDPRIENIQFDIEGQNAFQCGSENSVTQVINGPIDGNSIEITLYAEFNGCIDSLTRSFPYEPGAIADLEYRIDCDDPFEVSFFDNSSQATTSSLIIQGVTDTTFRLPAQPFTGLDSLVLDMPARGTYRAILTADNANITCGASQDTIIFYITQPEAIFNLDERICSGSPLILDASGSQDANATCNIGYQWDFSWDRPYVTDDDVLDQGEVQAGARGEQWVDLIIRDINGCVDTTRDTIQLYATILDITASRQRICLPATVSFNLGVDADTTITEYMWNFAGLGSSSERNPSFTFPAGSLPPGDITISVQTTDALNCPSTSTITLTVYEPRSNVITQPLPPAICEGDQVRFEASDFNDEGSFLQFNWNFGNGQTSQNRIQTVTYNQSGVFNATLVYTEQATGCQNDTTIQVIVEEAPDPNFSSDIDGQSIVCHPAIVTFSDQSTSAFPYTSIWLAPNASSAGETFTTGLPRGTTDITMIAVTNAAGCADTITRSFTLVGPDGDFTLEPGVICLGDEVTFTLRDTVDVSSWTWDFGNGTTQNNTNPATVVYDFRPPSGRIPVSLTLRSASNECTFTVVDSVRFEEVIADFIVDQGGSTACTPVVNITDQSIGAVNYLYRFPDGTTSTNRNPDFDFGAPGTYSVTLIVNNGGSCVDSITREITILPALQVDIISDGACVGESASLILTANRDIGQVFFRPNDLITSQAGNTFFTRPLTESTTVELTVIDTFGCSVDIENVNITVAEPFAGEGDTIFTLRNTPVTIEVSNPGPYNFRWLNPSAVGCDDCDNPTVTPSDNTSYVLEVSGPGSCPSRQITFVVIVFDEPIVPNLFTPDGDGTNDVWGPLFPSEITPEVNVYQVFSRWGSLVFESDDSAAKWSGDNNGGGDAPSDTYTYVIRFVYPNGTEFNQTGEVTLVR